MLDFYSASTRILNSRIGIRECIAEAVGNDKNEDVKALFIYCGIEHDYQEILTEAKKSLPNARIVGCTGAGIIGKEGPEESVYGIAVMAVTGNDEEIVFSHVDGIDGRNSYEKAKALATKLRSKSQKINMIYYLSTGIDVSNDKAIEGIESVFGNIPIFGATSSDTMKAQKNFQFCDEDVYENAAIAVGFADPTLEVITGATHGFVIKEGSEMKVTRSKANRVIELDNQQAWKVLTHKLGVTEDADLGLVIPIGALAEPLPEEYQEDYGNTHILRVISRKDDEGSFYSTAEVKEGETLMLTERDEDKIFQGTDALVKKIISKSGNRKPVAIFHADCGARGKLFKARVLKEEIVHRMQGPLVGNAGSVPWLGIYGFGEFARIKDKNFYHNYTTSLFVMYRKTG